MYPPRLGVCSGQSDQIWRNLPLLQKIQVFGKCLTVYLLFGKMLTQLWQIWYIIGLIFIVSNGKYLKIT